jgi:hypothetical protein
MLVIAKIDKYFLATKYFGEKLLHFDSLCFQGTLSLVLIVSVMIGGM